MRELFGKRKKSLPPIVNPVWGDTHPNSTVGLIHPDGVKFDDGGWYKPNKVQNVLWDAHTEYWSIVDGLKRELGARCIGVFLGDGTDDNRHSKHQLISPNHAVQLRIAEDVMRPALETCDEIYYVRGTEAHAGGAGELEETLAKRIGAVQDPETDNYSWWTIPLTFYNINGFYAHHPYSNSMRPWTQGGGANRTAAMMFYDWYSTGDKPPDFAYFGHVHHSEDSSQNFPTRVMFSRCWKGTAAHGHRIGFSGKVSPVGGAITTILPTGEWRVKTCKWTPKRRTPLKVA